MSERPYTVMPLRFRRFQSKVLITSESGDYQFLAPKDFQDFVDENLDSQNPVFLDLKSKDFLAEGDQDLARAIDMTATRYRSRKHFLELFTSLHMIVVTLRCNQKCEYCQVSCEGEDAYKTDMSPETVRKIIDFVFMSPSPEIKIEFQGGEPLLNWGTVMAAVEYAKEKNTAAGKYLSFVLCTNLTTMNEEKLRFLKANKVHVSTSLDGPSAIHDANRVFRIGGGTHATFLDRLALARKELTSDDVAALMTTTTASVDSLRDVVDEYVRLGFPGIFFRALNPYGFAHDNAAKLSYSMEVFVENYKRGLDYIIGLNLRGTNFIEFYTSLLLTRILTPFSTGFVDLQSPSGAGISGVIYDYNGDVYPADEARMLSRMGDNNFLMGNVFSDSYHSIFKSRVLTDIVQKSCLEIMPVCADCAYLPYCGADPVRNYLETKDIMGKRPSSPFCDKHMRIFDHLFDLLDKGNRDVMDVFWSWVTRRNLTEVRCENH
jgi:His-Xaa-Ser system radical SAM maturase HxsB